MNIYICIAGEAKGPFEKSAVFTMLVEKKICVGDFACCEGDSEWTTVEEVIKRGVAPHLSIKKTAPTPTKVSLPRPRKDSVYHKAANLQQPAHRQSSFGWLAFAIPILIGGILLFFNYRGMETVTPPKQAPHSLS
jgi:hypothetical protein